MIYPPTLQSSQPAFLYNTVEYPIYFTLQRITSFKDIGHAQVRVVRQTNNKSVINTEVYPDGTIYKDPSEINSENGQYSIAILKSELIEPWQQGQLYKVQMRFGTNPKYTSREEFATWKKEQIDNNAFSEWSTVMIIKPIDRPDVEIQNARIVATDIVSAERVEPTLTPLFEGSYSITNISNELLNKYRFNLYDGEYIDDAQLIESSGWIQYDANENAGLRYRFKTVLNNRQTYTVLLSTETVNRYFQDSEQYTFMATQTYLDPLENTTFKVDSEDSYCKENGCINIYLDSDQLLSGTYVITRSSEATNYIVWEDLQFLTYPGKYIRNELIYQDFTIESGIKYKYAIQQENSKGLRTTPLYEEDNLPHWVDFEYSYIYRDGIQLKLKYNNTMNSFKHSVLASKQDTLGGKYPHLVKNGYAYYAEFPVAGLISFQMDTDQTFFTMGEKGYYYKDELIIPIDKFDLIEGERQPNTFNGDHNIITRNQALINLDLIPNNIFVERKFREKVEEFLNDFNYKLYKSPTEGNIVIGLMNVSLSPKKELGRMIFEFTATAYEVLENTLSNLDKASIINIGQFQSLASNKVQLSFGQINDIYTTNKRASVNIYDLIKQKEEINVGDNYKLSLKKVRSLWVERAPERNVQIQLDELIALRANLQNNNEDTAAIDAQIQELEDLQRALKNPLGNTILVINGQQIIIQPHRIYNLRESVTSIEVVSSVYPLIFNYVCELTTVEDESTGVISAVDASYIWGQISGVFTGTDKILKTYNFYYNPGEPPLQVFNGNPDKTIIKDPKGNIIADNTNFNVYKTVNLYDIIKEDTQRQVELIYDTSGPFRPDENGDLNVDGIYYRFYDIVEFDIEAEPGARLLISKQADGSNSTEVVIGPTGRYVLKPIEGLIRYVALRSPQHALINYRCYTTQLRYT